LFKRRLHRGRPTQFLLIIKHIGDEYKCNGTQRHARLGAGTPSQGSRCRVISGPSDRLYEWMVDEYTQKVRPSSLLLGAFLSAVWSPSLAPDASSTVTNVHCHPFMLDGVGILPSDIERSGWRHAPYQVQYGAADPQCYRLVPHCGYGNDHAGPGHARPVQERHGHALCVSNGRINHVLCTHGDVSAYGN
jgi:hypothetical protein